VAIAYAIVAWLLIQVATQVFPFFEMPNWGVRLIVLFIVIGFPIALVIAWAFELTPEGIKRTEVAETAQSAAVNVGGQSGSIIPEKSIAVLPFQNLSKDEENAFFADGVQDEILANLSKVADLKVISRTSVMQYKNTATRNLPEIAQALKVAHVLEGSVQRSVNRVRVSAPVD